MHIIAKVDDPPECLLVTQHFLSFADGSLVKLPSVRQSIGNGRQVITYGVAVPRSAPLGQASFLIRENYGCGSNEPIEAGPLTFEVKGD